MLSKLFRARQAANLLPAIYQASYYQQIQQQSSGASTSFFEGKVKQNTNIVLGVVQKDLKSLQSALQDVSQIKVPSSSKEVKSFVSSVEQAYKKQSLPDDFEESDIQLDDALIRSGGDLKLAIRDFANDVEGTVIQDINSVLDKASTSGVAIAITPSTASGEKQKLRQAFVPLLKKLKIDSIKGKGDLKIMVAEDWVKLVNEDNKDKASTFARHIGLGDQIDFSGIIPSSATPFGYTEAARRKGVLLVASIMQKLQK